VVQGPEAYMGYLHTQLCGASSNDPSSAILGIVIHNVLQVTIIHVNRPPVLVGLQALSVDENASPPVLAGSISAFDPDGDTLTFSLAIPSPFFTLVSPSRRLAVAVGSIASTYRWRYHSPADCPWRRYGPMARHTMGP
jgi:hypothetical protein